VRASALDRRTWAKFWVWLWTRIAQIEAYVAENRLPAAYRDGWHAGHAAGVQRARQRGTEGVDYLTLRCPHCPRPVRVERADLERMERWAEDDDHRREMLAAHCAGLHGHARVERQLALVGTR